MHKEAWWGRWWIRLHLAARLGPRGQSAAVGRDVAPPDTPPQVLAGSYLLLSGLAAVAGLAAVHTLSERPLSMFFTLRHSFCLILNIRYSRSTLLREFEMFL